MGAYINLYQTMCEKYSNKKSEILHTVLYLPSTVNGHIAVGHFAVGHFAVGYFAVGHFAVGTFRRMGISPYGHFAVWTFRRTDFSPYGHFAVLIEWDISPSIFFCAYL